MLVLAVVLSIANALAEQDASVWDFPIAPIELQSDYVRLANADNLLAEDYVPQDLVKVTVKKASSSTIEMRQKAAEALAEMFDDAKDAGYTLYAKSGYRSYRTQKTMYYNRLERNNGVDDGYVTKPGASDHQTGLGIDVVNAQWRSKALNGDFAETNEARWLKDNCAYYGFVIRYPKEKEDITKIAFEPWHLRYVGTNVSQYMWEHSLCLEEFNQLTQPLLDAFIQSGADVSSVIIQDKVIVKFGEHVYQTGVFAADGEEEVSLFDSLGESKQTENRQSETQLSANAQAVSDEGSQAEESSDADAESYEDFDEEYDSAYDE